MNNQISIFCVNLERATERKIRLSKEWIDNLKLNINFWQAYDRRDIETGKYIYNYDPIKAKQTIGRELSYGEIACVTSYCMLYEFLLNNNYEEVIVMEDDVSPKINNKQELFDIIENGKKEFNNAEMFVLHGHNKKNNDKPLISKKYFSKYHTTPWGNMLIYLKKSGIIKLHNTLQKMMSPADHPQRILAYKKELNVIVVNNSLCKHNTMDTYIGNDCRFKKNVRNFIP